MDLSGDSCVTQSVELSSSAEDVSLSAGCSVWLKLRELAVAGGFDLKFLPDPSTLEGFNDPSCSAFVSGLLALSPSRMVMEEELQASERMQRLKVSDDETDRLLAERLGTQEGRVPLSDEGVQSSRDQLSRLESEYQQLRELEQSHTEELKSLTDYVREKDEELATLQSQAVAKESELKELGPRIANCLRQVGEAVAKLAPSKEAEERKCRLMEAARKELVALHDAILEEKQFLTLLYNREGQVDEEKVEGMRSYFKNLETCLRRVVLLQALGPLQGQTFFSEEVIGRALEQVAPSRKVPSQFEATSHSLVNPCCSDIAFSQEPTRQASVLSENGDPFLSLGCSNEDSDAILDRLVREDREMDDIWTAILHQADTISQQLCKRSSELYDRSSHFIDSNPRFLKIMERIRGLKPGLDWTREACHPATSKPKTKEEMYREAVMLLLTDEESFLALYRELKRKRDLYAQALGYK